MEIRNLLLISTNEKRVYKNTLALSLRTLVTIPIGLISVRLILGCLGAEDYGMANLLSGLTALASLITMGISNTAGRFLFVNLVNKSEEEIRRLFSVLLTVFCSTAVFLAIILEIFGCWMITSEVKMPVENVTTALIYFQLVVLTSVCSYIGGAYRKLLTAYEDISLLAWLSLGESFVHLLLVCGFYFCMSKHTIIGYGVLTFLTSCFSTMSCYILARIRYPHVTSFAWWWDKILFVKIISFAGWQLLTAISRSCYNMISAVLLNNYFSSALNATQGIATIIIGKLGEFSITIFSASDPQLSKLYTSGKIDEMEALFVRVVKFAFFILFLLGVPILANIEFVLDVWLEEPPAHTTSFVLISYFAMLANVTCWPCGAIINATGKIKCDQIIRSLNLWLFLSMGYIYLQNDVSPLCIPILAFFSNAVENIFRLALVRRLVPQFRFRYFLYEMIKRVVSVCILLLFCVCFYRMFFRGCYLGQALVSSVLLGCFTIVLIWGIGLTKLERKEVLKVVKNRLNLLIGREAI